MKNFKRILLINFGGIGDEILFLPVIRSLHKTYPEAHITLCLEDRSRVFVNLTDLIDDFFCINIKTRNKYIQMLKLYLKAVFGRYDLVISSGSSPLISVLLFFTGIKTKIGYKTSKYAEKLLTYAVKLDKNQYAGQMYFELAKPVVNTEFEYPIINTAASKKIKNSVLIHPGVSAMSVSKSITKTFGGKEWAKLIKEILKKGKNVYLAGGPDDNDCISLIREELKNTDLTNFQDMFGKTKNISELAELIKQSEVLICSDSAPMHIGVATNTRTIAVFGPTDEKKLLPQDDNFIAVHNNAACRPCLWDKRKTTCDDLKCLDISLKEITKYI